MKITDTIGDIALCYENGKFTKSGWDGYMDKVCPAAKKLIESDSASYVFDHDVLPVLNMVYERPDKLAQLRESFAKVTHGLEACVERALHSAVDADIVLYLGLCNGAGWATRVGDRPTILLGAEKIIELDWCDEISMIGLVYHELGHLWHFQNRTVQTDIKSISDSALWQLYTEGVAMYFEQMLCGDESFYHQNKNGWLAWCCENRQRIFAEYLRRVENGEGVQDFFGDWNSFEGYSDIGYYLGAELLHRAFEKYTQIEVLQLSPDEVRKLLADCAE